jgi:hypothetical protein
MARQAKADCERRAKIINAEGEFQASERLKDAAQVIEKHPTALQLRYLQTLVELGGSQSTTSSSPSRSTSSALSSSARAAWTARKPTKAERPLTPVVVACSLNSELA